MKRAFRGVALFVLLASVSGCPDYATCGEVDGVCCPGAGCAEGARCAEGLCRSRAWALWPMPNGASEAELPHPARYVAEENTVRDEVTGLVWQQDTESSDTTWEGARARCASLKLDGGGWALPTRIELVSLVDPTRSSPAIAPEISLVTGTPSLLFWTASPAASGDSLAWAVDFGVGQAVLAPKSTLALVRCVR